MHDELLSLVVPCYNEEDCLPLFYNEVASTLDELLQRVDEDLRFELIFVDDGSRDRTLEVAKALPANPPSHPRLEGRLAIRWVSFSRNFGKEAAIYAGLDAARGAYTAILDADLQDPPSLLIEMFCTLQREHADSVAARRVNRDGEPPIRSFFARQFYKIIQKISTADIVDGARDYRLMRRPVVDAILSLREYNRFSKGIFGWVGFKNVWVPYQHTDRAAGETKWSFFSLLLYALDGIVAFSTAPLSFASLTGIVLCIAALLAMLVILVRAMLFGDPVQGWPSLACIITFLGGIQLLCLGIMGQYLAKTYLETKRRPLYLVRETNVEPRAHAWCDASQPTTAAWQGDTAPAAPKRPEPGSAHASRTPTNRRASTSER